MASPPRRTWLDLRHPMFRPLWVRVLSVVIIGGWALVEATQNSVFWAILFGAAAGWMAWCFFVRFDPDDYV